VLQHGARARQGSQAVGETTTPSTHSRDDQTATTAACLWCRRQQLTPPAWSHSLLASNSNRPWLAWTEHHKGRNPPTACTALVALCSAHPQDTLRHLVASCCATCA
jgi:hypothetical protein